MTLLVDAGWLAGHRDEVDLVDVRWSPTGGTSAAMRNFEAGHIPGAVLFDIDRDLAGDPATGPGRHPLPSPEAFARTLGAAGIGGDRMVVAYDDAGGSFAARLWWMLEGTGRECALLDGALGAWRGPVETGPASPRQAVAVEPKPWPADRLADADAVLAGLRAGAVTVLDVRAVERYRGEVEPFDPVAGHIPGAQNAPWTENLDDDGSFRPGAELRARFTAIGVAEDARTIAQCGSGVTACHELFALRLAGLGDARLYEGSWSDWVRDPARPVATGDAPGSIG
jgi:thiosulfate/3-mercaptopyruvate sulfurtransferase